jgi:hypothetical protein
MTLQRQSLLPMTLRVGTAPPGSEDDVDGVDDAVVADDIGPVRRPPGVVVELPCQGAVHLSSEIRSDR